MDATRRWTNLKSYTSVFSMHDKTHYLIARYSNIVRYDDRLITLKSLDNGFTKHLIHRTWIMTGCSPFQEEQMFHYKISESSCFIHKKTASLHLYLFIYRPGIKYSSTEFVSDPVRSSSQCGTLM